MLLAVAALWAAGGSAARAQTLTYRGFAEAGLTFYPERAPNDPTHLVGDALVRFEPSLEVRRGIVVAAAFDARADTHDQTARSVGVDYWDRGRRRPALAFRRLAVTLARGPLTLEIGKQFVRWGPADIVNPTDRFTPRDYLTVAASEILAPTAARLTLAGAADTIELVFTPRLTPSRMPLLEQRWIGLQAATAGLALRDAGARYPGGPQYGLRWSRRTPGSLEYAASFFQGYHHLPRLEVGLDRRDAAVLVRRVYPGIRVWGAELVAPLAPLTLRAEGAWLQARRQDADEYVLWVLQAERQQGEWLLIGGYVGEHATHDRGELAFAPDRGLARAVVGRAAWTIDDRRSLAIEGVVRQDGDGLSVKTEYSHGVSARWRVTLRLLAIRGGDGDFLGQYRRNSFSGLSARFSF
jgi:hypothetical protein